MSRSYWLYQYQYQGLKWTAVYKVICLIYKPVNIYVEVFPKVDLPDYKNIFVCKQIPSLPEKDCSESMDGQMALQTARNLY